MNSEIKSISFQLVIFKYIECKNNQIEVRIEVK